MSSPVKLTTRLPAPSLIASIDSISVHQYLTIRKVSNRSFEIPNRRALNNYISIIFSTIYVSTNKRPIFYYSLGNKNILQIFPYLHLSRQFRPRRKSEIPLISLRRNDRWKEEEATSERGGDIITTGRKNGRTFPKEGSSTQVVGVQRMLDPPAARFFFFFFSLLTGRNTSVETKKGVRVRGLIFE